MIKDCYPIIKTDVHARPFIYSIFNPSSKDKYSGIASSISLIRIYSSAVCERLLLPGPILNEGKGIRAWSLKVGDPKGTRPNAMACLMIGWFGAMRDDDKRNERAVASLLICCFISSKIS